MDDVLESFANICHARGLVVRSPASQAEVDAFERQHRCLPTDMKKFYLRIDGMLDQLDDVMDIRIWTLSEIGSIPEKWPEAHVPDGDPKDWYVFADALVSAWGYAIRLCPEGSESNDVLLIGSTRPTVVAGTFHEFLAKYLAGDRSLLPSEAASRGAT